MDDFEKVIVKDLLDYFKRQTHALEEISVDIKRIAAVLEDEGVELVELDGF